MKDFVAGVVTTSDALKSHDFSYVIYLRTMRCGMLITTACPSCTVPLNISSHVNGKIISCVNCGHKFTVNLVADLAPVVPAPPVPSPTSGGREGGQSDWQEEPPPIRRQPSGDPPVVSSLDQEWEFDDGGSSPSPGILENVVSYRRRDGKRVGLAVLGVLFSLASLACLWAWLLTHSLPWVYGSAACTYVGAHLSLFGKGPIRIVGVVLNIAVLVGCIVSVMLLKGLIRIELGG